MPVPSDAFKFGAAMDPAEILDYRINLRDAATKLLEDTENIASYTLTLYPDAVLAGLNIMSGSGRDPVMGNDYINVWFDFDVGSQTDPMYDGSGVSLAMELTVITNSVPSRKRQRTIVLGVKQQ